jgi:hypothetical protein
MSDISGCFVGDFDRRIWVAAGLLGTDLGRREGDLAPKPESLAPKPDSFESVSVPFVAPESEPQSRGLNPELSTPTGHEEVPRETRLGVRVTPEALAWVQGLADHCSVDCSTLIWQSLLRQAEGSGYHIRIPLRYRRKRANLHWPRPSSDY